MSEDKGELDKTSPSQLPSPSDTFLDKETTLERIEERLAKATSPEEIVLWTRIRGEIIRQNEIINEGKHRRSLQIKNNQHQRSLEKIQVIRKTVLAGGAVTIGIGLIISGFTVSGIFVLGVGFNELAPGYMKNIFSKKNNNEENAEK